MKPYFLSFTFLLCGALSVLAAGGERPNVILIMADDMGYEALSSNGSESCKSPNLDKLAAKGLRFSQFYNAARCCPTRAALLTGLYPHRAGVGHMLRPMHPPSYTAGLGANTISLAQMLKPAGYRSYHAGKWHVGGVGSSIHSTSV